jgi:hypothetical protein
MVVDETCEMSLISVGFFFGFLFMNDGRTSQGYT